MSQDNFMFEWKKHTQYYDVLQDGSYRLHEDAPFEIKESFEAYCKLFQKIDSFPKRKSKGLASLFKGKQPTVSNETRPKKSEGKIAAVFDAKSKTEIANQLSDGLQETKVRIERSLALPFWYDRKEAIQGCISVERHFEKSAEIILLLCKEDSALLYASLRQWCEAEGILYLSAKVDTKESAFIEQLLKLQFVQIDVDENNLQLYVRKL